MSNTAGRIVPGVTRDACRALLFLAPLSVLASCGGPDILAHEPAGGALDNGQTVLVDDGRCPAGQVSQVTGPASLLASRTYACVRKP